MTVSVPSNDKSGAAAKQAQIATLATRTDYQSVQLKNQLEIEQVHTLLDQQHLTAANIISTLPATIKRGPLYAQITAQTALVASIGAGPTANAASATLDQLQRQLVTEEMISGARTAASILASSLTYVGGAR